MIGMDRPARTASEEFRSGWGLILIAMLGCGLGVSSLPLYTAGIFMPSLERHFGWTRAEMSGSILAFTLTLAVASPLVGRIVDRFGVRKSAIASICAAAGCYLLLATTLSSLPRYYAAHVAIAGLGAAAAPVAYTRIIAAHFVAARGLALGLTLLGPSIAAAVAPPLAAHVIETGGWQAGYLLLAAATAAMLPCVLLLREAPGRQVQPSAIIAMAAHPALPRLLLGRLIAAFAVFSLGVGGLIVHFMPMLTDAGLPMATAARIAALLGIAGIAGRLVGGVLADRCFAPFILAGVAVSAALGCLSLAIFGSSAAIFAALAVGFSLGAEADLMGYVVSRYYPQHIYGRMFGWTYAAFIVGIGVSPMIIGLIHDQTRSYAPGLAGSTFLLLIAALLFGRLPRYARI
jgi:MFS family permease